jgi:transcriptional regulator with XRE-family HTH domain
MTVVESIDRLRGRYIRLLKGQDEQSIAQAIGLHRNTLLAFRHGASLKIATLQRIESWCDQAEESHP